MAEWIRPPYTNRLRELAEGWQAGLAQVDGLAEIGETITTLLNGAGIVIGAVEQLLSADPLSAALQVFSTMLGSLLDDLRSADVYMLPVCPVGWASMLRPYPATQAIADIQASLGDTADGSRPTSDTLAPYAQMTILVGADNWADFQALLDAFGKVFSADFWGNWGTLSDMRKHFNAFQRVPRQDRNSQGNPWDWTRATSVLHIMPPLEWIFDKLEALLYPLGNFASGLGESIQDLARILQKKLAMLRSLIDQVLGLLSLLAEWAKLVPNMYVLYTAGATGGVLQYSRDLQQATNAPTYKLTCGMTFLATGVNPVNQFNRLWEFLGFEMTALEGQYAQVREDLANA